MASDQKFADFICEQLRGAGSVTSRKMFGEFAVYRADKVVALICDNQLFVKPTGAGRAILGRPVEAPPYPGAKPHYLIDDGIDDAQWLSGLIVATAADLPAAKPKKVLGRERRRK